MRPIVSFAIITAMALSSAAQEDSGSGARMAGPLLGYAPDSSMAGIRPILGIPGAALLDAPLACELDIVRGVVSPRQNYVLFQEGDGWMLAPLGGGGISASPLEAAGSGFELAALSPSGASAALYSRETNVVRILTGLPDAVRLVREVDLSALDPPASTMAVDDSGETLLAATGGDSGGVFLFTAAERGRLLLAATEAAMTFFARSSQAVIADRRGNAVYRVWPATGMVAPLAGAADGIQAPVAVQVSSDNVRAFVANAGGAITILDLAGGPALQVDCGCAPTGFYRLRGDDVFRLTEPADGTVWLLDGAGPAPRVVFVPPAPEVVAPAAERR